MQSQSAKAKGRRGEHAVVSVIRESGVDVDAEREFGSGAFLGKGDISGSVGGFTIEVKNQATIKMLSWVDQAKKQAIRGSIHKDRWGVVFFDPRVPEIAKELYITMDFGQFLELIKKNDVPIVKSDDRLYNQKLFKAQVAIHELLKYIEDKQ